MSTPLDFTLSPSPPSTRRRATKERRGRKKACDICAKDKVHCDQNRPTCSRCVKRSTVCVYATAPRPLGDDLLRSRNNPLDQVRSPTSLGQAISPPDSSLPTISNTTPFTSSTLSPAGSSSYRPVERSQSTTLGYVLNSETPTVPGTSPNAYWKGSYIDFQNLLLVCSFETSRIRDRWLRDFIPSLNDRAKTHSPEIVHFVSQVFGTYPMMLLKKGNLPPYMHHSQFAGDNIPTPLANCLSLVRLWDSQVRGGELIVRETVKSEMDRLYRERKSYDHMDQLAAFQAYLTYAMMAFFSSDSGSLVDRQVIVNLQDFGCEISSRGLVCPGEVSHTRPDWESWIVASTKRRCLYAMYLFDNIFCSRYGIPTFLGEELESLPVPAGKFLWECQARELWEKEYNSFLDTWDGGGLRIDELWPAPESGREARRKRIDKWLGTVDEFGMMLYAVTSVTHGT